MGERTFLGEVEHLVLASMLRLGEDAYGGSVIREIEARTGREVPAGTVYVTLDRLEEKGLLTSSQGVTEPGRGGRPRRMVALTKDGLAAVAEHRAALLRVWEGFEAELGEAL
jgi:PadR family transcriptional regulator PadR